MLLDRILSCVDLPQAAVRFITPPQSTYLIYMVERRRYGSDSKNLLEDVSVTFEVYSYDFLDNDALEMVGQAIDAAALEYIRYDTVYLDDEQLYMTTFLFNYIEKIPIRGADCSYGDRRYRQDNAWLR